MEEILLKKLLEDMPDYQAFLTADEMDESSKQLAAKYPECVTLFEIGQTEKGKTLYCMKIGESGPRALLLGCPHPNEPIGAMMLEYFSRALAENEELRRELGYSWYIVKMCDRDGVELNENWYKGPFTIENYARHFFRPASNRQPEWTFPVQYKEYVFEQPMSETKALMGLMEKVQPEFTYVLHNAGFGGVFWYLSKNIPEIYDAFHKAAKSKGLPLQSGGESELGKSFSEAIFRTTGIEEVYDYDEKIGVNNIADRLSYGTSSAAYCKQHYGAESLMTEIPYFYAPKLEDYSESDRILREVLLEKVDFCDWSDKAIQKVLNQVTEIISPKNPFLQMLIDFSGGQDTEIAVNSILGNPENQRLATQAEVCQEIYITKFLKLLNHATLIRMLDEELKKGHIDGEDSKFIYGCKKEAEQWFDKVLSDIENGLEYDTVPIKSAVSIQLESGIRFATALKKERNGR